MISGIVHLLLDGELMPSSDLLQLPAWTALVFLATMTVFIIHLIILMLARAFDIADLKAYAESEMLQAVATFFMAGFIVLLLSSAADFTYKQLLSGGELECGGVKYHIQNNVTAFADGLDIVKCKLLDKASAMRDVKDEIRTTSADSGIFDYLNKRTSYMGYTEWEGDWDPYAYQTAESYRYANIMATHLLVALNAQAFFVVYVKKNMIQFFLPLGIVLRGFNFTRAIGAFLIALAIGLYFILPVLFVLTDPGFIRMPPTASVLTNPTSCYKTFAGVVNLVDLPQVEAIGQMQREITMSSVIADLSGAYLGLLVHPFVVLSITLIFIRYGMTLLGGETMELMRLVARVV